MEKINEIKPKFKVGDCIVSNYDNIAFIESIGEKTYNLLCIEGFHENLSIGYVNRNWHLWSIEDAKDGDVLIWEDGWTCIFKCIHGIWFSSYCFIDCDGVFHEGYEEHEVDATINGSVNIANREQRNLFLTRVEDAGWHWNVEDKKLEPKSVELNELLSELDKEIKDFITTDEFDRDSAIGGHYWAIAKHAFLLGFKYGKTMIDKSDIENILKGLWKEDNGQPSESRIAFNEALQKVQIALDALEEKKKGLL